MKNKLKAWRHYKVRLCIIMTNLECYKLISISWKRNGNQSLAAKQYQQLVYFPFFSSHKRVILSYTSFPSGISSSPLFLCYRIRCGFSPTQTFLTIWCFSPLVTTSLIYSNLCLFVYFNGIDKKSWYSQIGWITKIW